MPTSARGDPFHPSLILDPTYFRTTAPLHLTCHRMSFSPLLVAFFSMRSAHFSRPESPFDIVPNGALGDFYHPSLAVDTTYFRTAAPCRLSGRRMSYFPLLAASFSVRSVHFYGLYPPLDTPHRDTHWGPGRSLPPEFGVVGPTYFRTTSPCRLFGH